MNARKVSLIALAIVLVLSTGAVAATGSFSSSSSTAAVTGKNTGSGAAGTFSRSATSGASAALQGITKSGSSKAAGVYGLASGTGNARTYGVSGRSNATTGVGVFGFASSTTGGNGGVLGQSNSPDGFGVQGTHSATTGTAPGVRGVTKSLTTSDWPVNAGVGVYGDVATPGDSGNWWSVAVRGRHQGHGGAGIGVWGSQNGGGWGVFGEAVGGVGVVGYADDPLGLAAYMIGDTGIEGNAMITGNLDVWGTLSKGAGSFKIDHPLDPTNKYLYHSFVESPDMMNIYNGNVRLSSNGSAWVDLPAWFGALNKDYRYQLTAIGGAAPDLHIASPVANNRFKIGGGPALGEVSWQVTGIRNDRYAQQNRIPVEEDKGDARGTYLHPEAWGKPSSLDVLSALGKIGVIPALASVQIEALRARRG